MSVKPVPDLSMRIAPKGTADYWSVQDWCDAQDTNDWPKTFQIFKDRIDYRFLSAIRSLDVSLEKKARLLACLAIESLEKDTFERKRDGIQYLLDNITAGIITPLTEPYRQALLQLADNAPDLSEARLRIARKKGILE
jgi:hypothetical protein